MNYKQLVMIMVVLQLTGCFRTQEILTDCFDSFTSTVGKHTESKEAYVYPFKRDAIGEEYLLNNDIVGYIFDHDVSFHRNIISTSSALIYTGDVYRYNPAIIESVFSGLKKHIQLVVEVEGRRYLLPNRYQEELPSIQLAEHCLDNF